MDTKFKYVLGAVCVFALLGCEKKSEVPSSGAQSSLAASPTPSAAVPSITESLSAPTDNAVVEIKDGNPCFSWAPLNTSAFESHILAVSTTPDFPTTRWQYKLNESETSVCWNGGSSWVAKGSTPPAVAADLTPDITYYWRVSARHRQSGAVMFSETRTFTMAAPSSSSDTNSAK